MLHINHEKSGIKNVIVCLYDMLLKAVLVARFLVVGYVCTLE